MVDSALGDTHPIVPDRGHGRVPYAPRQGGSGGDHGVEPALRAGRDRVELSTRAAAVLQVLRERVLHHTRTLLEHPETGHPRAFAHADDLDRPAAFLGRLLSDQNLLAAARAGLWAPERIRRVVADAITLGAGDTLDVLHDVDRLDAEAWAAVEAVLLEFRRKLAAAEPAVEAAAAEVSATAPATPPEPPASSDDARAD